MKRRFVITEFPKGFAIYDRKQKDYIINAEYIEDDKLICLKKRKVKKIKTEEKIGDAHLNYIFEVKNKKEK